MRIRRNRRIPLVAAAAALLIALPGRVATGEPFSPDFYFDPDIYEAVIQGRFSGRVMGFSSTVVDSAGIQALTSGGFAQAPGDGDVDMKTFIHSGIGSVSKVLSGIALLNLMEEKLVADATVQEQLDMPIFDMLPQKWQDAYSDLVFADTTFRHLLTHRSGFRLEDSDLPASANGRRMQYVISQDVSPADVGDRDYNNYNITLLKFLIPAIAYPDDVQVIHDFYDPLDIDSYSIAINFGYGLLYEQYMMEEIFPNAVDFPINATCRPADDLDSDQYAKAYTSASSTVGTVLGLAGNPCISQGSWYLTALGLARFARTFGFTSNYISPATHDSMYDPDMPDDRLIYNFTIMNDRFNLDQDEFAYHGGTQGYRAALVALPYGFFGVGMINSEEFSSVEVAQAVLDSFQAAIEDTPPRIIPNFEGTRGKSNWWVSDVELTWNVYDLDSNVVSEIGCGPSTISTDTSPSGVSFTCTATSLGGTDSVTTTVYRDATAPTVAVVGVVEGGIYVAADPPTVTCSASDPVPGSGVQDPSPVPAIVDEGGGFFTATCTALDVAGNQNVASVEYKLVSIDVISDEVAASSLNGGNQNSLLKKLANAQKRLDGGRIKQALNAMMAFENEVLDLIAEGDLPAEEGQVLLDGVRVLIDFYS